MMRNLFALVAGVIFGVGLTISQMVNPSKVVAFLDLFGSWDPSLAFVMGGALIITTLGYRWVMKKDKPIFAEKFQIPNNQSIDARLALGSVLFGIGWGLVGLCPGPAVAALTIGGLPILVFLCAVFVGAGHYELLNRVMNNSDNLHSTDTR